MQKNQHTERIICVQKQGQDFKAGQRVYADLESQCASDTPEHVSAELDERGMNRIVPHPLVGICGADADRNAFSVDVRIPIPEPGDLRVVQCVATGRHTADGRPLVVPFLVNRRFKQTDNPEFDRHPVEHMIDRDKHRQADVASTPAVAVDAEPEPIPAALPATEKPAKRKP